MFYVVYAILILLAGLVLLGPFVTGVLLVRSGGRQDSRSKQLAGKIVLTAGSGQILLAVTGFVFIALWFCRNVWRPFLICMLLAVAAGVAAGLLRMWQARHRARWFIRGGATLLAAACLVSGIWARVDDSIAVVEENANLLYEYSPLLAGGGSRLVSLPEEATLRFAESAPRMDGATALYPVYAAFANAVCTPQTLNADTLTCSTTIGAYNRLIAGECDIIFVAGPSDEELAAAKEAGVELVLTPIGREAFVFFVNSRNPLENLTLEQVQGIYSGEITRWQDLGVSGLGGIRAFQRRQNSGSQTTMQRLMGDVPLMQAPEENVVDTMSGVLRKTSSYKNYRNAIGYSFRFYATEMNPQAGIRLLALDGVSPTEENIRNGTYPAAYCFYAVTRADAGENTLALLQWVQGAQGQYLIEQTGYTPVNSTAEQE